MGVGDGGQVKILDAHKHDKIVRSCQTEFIDPNKAPPPTMLPPGVDKEDNISSLVGC